MQVSFYGKTYSFTNKEELYRVQDEIYYFAQDKEKELIREFDEKKERAVQKLRQDALDMYRKLKDKESTLKNSKEESYYAKLSEEKASKKNAEEKRIFKVMGEEFDISTVGGMKKAAEAIEYHFRRKRDELGLPTAEQWKAKIGHELLLKARER